MKTTIFSIIRNLDAGLLILKKPISVLRGERREKVGNHHLWKKTTYPNHKAIYFKCVYCGSYDWKWLDLPYPKLPPTYGCSSNIGNLPIPVTFSVYKDNLPIPCEFSRPFTESERWFMT